MKEVCICFSFWAQLERHRENIPYKKTSVSLCKTYLYSLELRNELFTT